MKRSGRAFWSMLSVVAGCGIATAEAAAQDRAAVAAAAVSRVEMARPGRIAAVRALPDLEVRQVRFVPAYDKGVRIQVANFGKTPAAGSMLRLTVRRIDGVAVGRTIEVPVPPIGPVKAEWVAVDAASILPNSVDIAATTFRLDVDAAGAVAESAEGNNTTWHNL